MWSLFGLVPYAAAAAVVFGAMAAVGRGAQESIEDLEEIHWDPVWVGGPEPWVIKVYKNPEHPVPAQRGWAVDVLLYGELKHNKEWRGIKGKYVSLAYAQAYANEWIKKYIASEEWEGGGS